MEDLTSAFLAVTRKLEAAEIPYMIVGSIASMTYGEPRMTHDLDLVEKVSGLTSYMLAVARAAFSLICYEPSQLALTSFLEGFSTLYYYMV